MEQDDRDDCKRSESLDVVSKFQKESFLDFANIVIFLVCTVTPSVFWF